MMKRFICILTAVALVFALSACGKTPETPEVVTSVSQAEAGGITQMPDFESVDLEGNAVDSTIFEQADITVVNFWGTFCPPCIDEMPALAEWDEELPENVQIIGIVVDVPSETVPELETAKELVAQSGIKYTNIIASDQFGGVFQHLIGVPTTFFVDSEGKVLCDEVIGADVDAYKRMMEDLQ